MDLTALGLARADLGGLPPARVGRVCGGTGYLADVWSSVGRATIPVSPAAGQPVTGDWVRLSRTGDDTGRGKRDDAEFARSARVSGILPRRTAIRRISTAAEHRHQVLAANVDTAFVCLPVGAVSPFLVDSLVAVAVSSGAGCTLVVTKTDLATARDWHETSVLLAGLGQFPVIYTSARTGAGIPELAEALAPDLTGVLIGASGVGKSALTNALIGSPSPEQPGCGEEPARTGATGRSGQGRHTTTARDLYLVQSGGVLIDTPGLRSVTPALDATVGSHIYADIADLAAECRFTDCGHETEPGCAVQAAIASGDLSQERLARHRRMEREARRQQEVAKWAAARDHKGLVSRAKAAKRRGHRE